MNTINCPNCGAEAPVGSAFCDSCGNSLAGVAARPGPGSGAGFGLSLIHISEPTRPY